MRPKFLYSNKLSGNELSVHLGIQVMKDLASTTILYSLLLQFHGITLPLFEDGRIAHSTSYFHTGNGFHR